MMNEKEFVSLNIPAGAEIGGGGGGLNFLPSNYDYNNPKSSDNSDTENGASLNLGDKDASSQQYQSEGIRHRGVVGSYMDKYGVGWLLDQSSGGGGVGGGGGLVDMDEDERLSLLEELDINVNEIQYKIKCVMMPPLKGGEHLNRAVLRDSPDFWGPLLVVLAYALISVYGQLQVVSWIITIWIVGSFLVFVMARILGGEVTYSQIVGTIGYSLLPMVTIACVLPLFRRFHYLSNFLKMAGVCWSTYSAATLLCVQELAHKRPLLLYPIFLLYIYFLSVYSGV